MPKEQEGLAFSYLEWQPRVPAPDFLDRERWAGAPAARWFLALVEQEILEVLSLLASQEQSTRSSELRGQVQGFRKVIALMERERKAHEEERNEEDEHEDAGSSKTDGDRNPGARGRR